MDIAVIILGILCATIIVTAIIQSSRLSMWRTRAHEAVERAERAENALTSLSREQQRGAAVDDMRQVVEPLRGRIETLGSNMAAFIQEQRDADNTTRRNINDILAATRDVERQTRDLNRNISGNNNTQGRWGEVLLGNILAATGMVRGRDYDLQCVVAADETADTTRRPDAIVHLPGNRNVVIDAKTSITAYIKYLEAQTNEDKAQCLREHVASVRRQIDNLASKHYDARVEGSPEFVILFMPNDDALATATAADATIYEYAYNKRVVPASPALLLAILQIVEMQWRAERRTKQQQEIIRVGSLVLEDLQRILGDISAVGKALNQALAAWQSLNTHATSDAPRSITARIRTLGELGIASHRRQ